MPCWEVRTMSVEFQARNRDLLLKAIGGLGWQWTEKQNIISVCTDENYFLSLDLVSGRASVPQYAFGQLNKLKRQYSKVTIEAVAKKKGWATRKTITKNKMQFVKY